MKLSKAAKARIKIMSSVDKKALVKSAHMLAMNEVISYKRYEAIARTCRS
jgi:hypothetical protein